MPPRRLNPEVARAILGHTAPLEQQEVAEDERERDQTWLELAVTINLMCDTNEERGRRRSQLLEQQNQRTKAGLEPNQQTAAELGQLFDQLVVERAEELSRRKKQLAAGTITEAEFWSSIAENAAP